MFLIFLILFSSAKPKVIAYKVLFVYSANI